MTGVFSIASSQFDGSGGGNIFYAVQNTGATIYGSMNSIESATSDNIYSGVASSVLGFANRTQNANAALIWGTGNEVTNSIESIGIKPEWNNLSVADAQKKAIKAMQSNQYAGGSVLAIGGGNKADYATYSELTGVQNKVTGTKAKAAKYDLVNGYQNTVENASDVTVIGIKNKVTADGNKVIGDNHQVSGKDNVIIGSAVELTETKATDTVIVGHNAKVTALEGVAVGAHSEAAEYAAAFGGNAKAKGNFSVAVGNEAKASALESISIGYNSSSSESDAIAIGADSVASGTNSIALSKKATASGKSSIAFGNLSKATGLVAVAIGEKAEATAEDTIAIGGATKATSDYSIAIGNDIDKTGDHAVAIGQQAHAYGDNSIAFGTQAKATAADATAFGVSARAEKATSVALGSGSVADREASVQGYDPLTGDKSALHSAAWESVKGAVSVGSNNVTRQIINVAAGTADTDAVNVAQLKKVSEKGWNLSTGKGEATRVQLGDTVDFSGDNNISVTNKGANVSVKLNNNVSVNSVNTGNFHMNQEGIGWGNKFYYITNKGLNANGFKITNVGKGEISDKSKDAVNGSQLYKVQVEAAKHTKIEAGDNVKVTATKTETGGLKYKITAIDTKYTAGENVTIDKDNKISAVDTKYTAGNGIAIDAAANNAISVNLKNGEKNLVVDENGLALSNKLTGIESISNGANGKAKIELKEFANGIGYVGIANGKASLVMYGEQTEINGKVRFDKDGHIKRVADGVDDKDAVNVSQLKKVATEAGKHTTLSNGKNTTVTSTNKDGQIDYQVNVAGDLTDITSVANGDSKINLNADSISISNGNKSFAITNSGIGMSYITADYSTKSIMLGENGTTISGGLNVAGSKITNVAAGVADTDAVNVGQLKDYVAANDTHIKSGDYAVGEVTDSTGNKSQGVSMDIVNKEGKVTGTVTITDVAKASDVGDVNNIASDIKNKEGKTTVVDAVNNLNNKVGDLKYSNVKKGEIADGDSTTTAIGKLNQKLTDVAATAAKHTTVTQGDNITVTKSDKPNENGGENYNVALKKDINLDSVTTDQTVMNKDGLKVGEKVSVTENGLKVGDKVSVTEKAVTAGKTSISDEGVKVDGKTYISDNGLNANNNKVTNVADGKENSDAVNYGQLKKSETTINNRIDGVENQVVSNSNRINQLGNRVNKVGAGAAALAALHPMDFDPDDKLTFSAGYGNYAGENAAAIGAYYRPDEKVMFSVGGTVGNGENMVNAGVSFALDRTNHVSNSRTAMAREILDLRAEVNELKAMVAKGGLGTIEEDKMKIFPDVAENHWAYEYIGKLAAAGIVEGYPDGNFNGDRMMSRYEFAAMLYRAMQKGAQLDSKIINEFAPEMGRIRVDRISGEDGDRDKIERVRVNAVKGERDHYGNKVAK